MLVMSTASRYWRCCHSSLQFSRKSGSNILQWHELHWPDCIYQMLSWLDYCNTFNASMPVTLLITISAHLKFSDTIITGNRKSELVGGFTGDVLNWCPVDEWMHFKVSCLLHSFAWFTAEVYSRTLHSDIACFEYTSLPLCSPTRCYPSSCNITLSLQNGRCILYLKKSGYLNCYLYIFFTWTRFCCHRQAYVRIMKLIDSFI